MLAVALAEWRLSLKEGGIPIGAAIFDQTGKLIGAGHNRRVQQGDPSAHAETDAFRRAGRQKGYRKLILVTTLARSHLRLLTLFGLGIQAHGHEIGSSHLLGARRKFSRGVTSRCVCK